MLQGARESPGSKASSAPRCRSRHTASPWPSRRSGSLRAAGSWSRVSRVESTSTERARCVSRRVGKAGRAVRCQVTHWTLRHGCSVSPPCLTRCHSASHTGVTCALRGAGTLATPPQSRGRGPAGERGWLVSHRHAARVASSMQTCSSGCTEVGRVRPPCSAEAVVSVCLAPSRGATGDAQLTDARR